MTRHQASLQALHEGVKVEALVQSAEGWSANVCALTRAAYCVAPPAHLACERLTLP
jgi:hypothetical protein